MDINDKIIEEKWEMLVKAVKENKKERIIETRQKRKGYEKFCDMLSCMTNEELKELGLKKCKELDNPNLTSVERRRINGEIGRIIQEYRIPNRTVKTNIKNKWFEDYGFLISYGVDGKIIPVGDIVIYQQLELYNGSSDIQEYENLSDEDKKKTLEAVFSNEKGDLKLRIPVGSLMELRDILEKYATEKLSDDEVISSLSSLSLDDMEATIESIDINGNATRTLLGSNYSLYPIEIRKDKEKIREKEKDTSDDLER